MEVDGLVLQVVQMRVLQVRVLLVLVLVLMLRVLLRVLRVLRVLVQGMQGLEGVDRAGAIEEDHLLGGIADTKFGCAFLNSRVSACIKR